MVVGGLENKVRFVSKKQLHCAFEHLELVFAARVSEDNKLLAFADISSNGWVVRDLLAEIAEKQVVINIFVGFAEDRVERFKNSVYI